MASLRSFFNYVEHFFATQGKMVWWTAYFILVPHAGCCFYGFCWWFTIPISCYIFNVFILVHVTVFSSRCMLELKFFIYYRAASLSSQASYAVLVEESLQAFLKHSPHTCNSAILRIDYISLLSDLCACIHMKKKWRRKGSHSSSVSHSNHLMWLQTWKKAMEKTFWPSGDFLVRYFRDAF